MYQKMLRIVRSSGGLWRALLHQSIQRRSLSCLIKRTTVAYSTNATRINDQNESTELREHLDNLKNLVKSNGLHDLIERLESSRNLSNLLTTIEPHLNELRSDHVQVIFNQLRDLFLKSTYKLREHNDKSIKEFYHVLQRSPVFTSLLDRVVHLDEHLNIECQLVTFQLFQMIYLDTNTEALKVVLKNLIYRSDEFSLDQLSRFLITLNNYIKWSGQSTDLFSKINEFALKIAKIKILNNHLNAADVDLTVRYFEVFLFNRDVEAINYLTKQLTSPDIEISYTQSIGLLRGIKKSIGNKRKSTCPPELNDDLNELIAKCNSSIVEAFKLEPTPSKVAPYLTRLHQTTDDTNLDSLFDQEILDSITPILTENQNNLSMEIRFCMGNMIRNFSKNNRYDDRLLRLGYDLICKLNEVDKKLFSYSFLEFYYLRLPFVDYQHLSKLALDWADEKDLMKPSINTLIQLLNELILNDVNDRRILNCFDVLLKRLDQRERREISLKRFRDLNLASVHLSSFSEIDHSLRSEVGRKFDALFRKFSIRRILKIQDYSQFTDKIQLGAYLSNGLFLSYFAIYDRSTRDLVPLTKFKHYFDQIDRIPLDENQQL